MDAAGDFALIGMAAGRIPALSPPFGVVSDVMTGGGLFDAASALVAAAEGVIVTAAFGVLLGGPPLPWALAGSVVALLLEDTDGWGPSDVASSSSFAKAPSETAGKSGDVASRFGVCLGTANCESDHDRRFPSGVIGSAIC